MERLPSAMHDLNWWSAYTATSLIPFGRFASWPLWHLACLCHVAGSNEVLRRTYGKDNRVPHTAKFSQGFEVVSPRRAWQGAGISTGGTKIGVTGAEAPGETEIEQGSNNHEPSEDVQSCGGVCAIDGFCSSTGGQEGVPYENHSRCARNRK